MSENTALMIVPLAETMELGKVLAQSGFFEDSKQAAQAVVKVLAGQEIGIGPIASMTGVHIIKGKPAIGAGLIASAIKRSGRYNYRVRQNESAICAIEFFERMGDKWESVGTSTFTLEDAKRAGTQNLDRFPRNMLFARCISNGAKWFTPDVFGGPVYTPEELGAPVNGDGEITEGTVRIVEPEKRQAAPPAADPEPPSDAEFRKLTSASEERAAQPATTDGKAAPKLAVNHAGMRYGQIAAAFAAEFPAYQNKNGIFDDGHIRASLMERGFAEITPENVEAAFAKLAEHALSKMADAEAAKRR